MSIKSSIKTVLTLGKGVTVGIPPAAEDVDPIEFFEVWYEAAEESGIFMPEAVALATTTPDGAHHPYAWCFSSRSMDRRGFVFFTNYEKPEGE